MPLNVDSVWLVIGVDSPGRKKQLLPFPIQSLKAQIFHCVWTTGQDLRPHDSKYTLLQAYAFGCTLARARGWGIATCKVFYSAMAVSKASWD